jgi:hypothetical protein
VQDLKLHLRNTPLALYRLDLLVGGALAAAGLVFAPLLTAQTQPPETAAPAQVQPAGHAAKQHDATAQKPSEVQAVPPQPPAPDWPINNQPAPAKVAWNSPQLRIDAENSSLDQILTDVATATGAEVVGLAGDQRVFGSFGPGTTRDVLSQLLQGTGYNIMMVGDQGQGVPKQIVLSARSTAKAQPGTAHPTPDENEEDLPDYPQYDSQPQQSPPVPQPIRPGFPDQPMSGRPPQQVPQTQQAPGQPGQQPNAPQNQ